MSTAVVAVVDGDGGRREALARALGSRGFEVVLFSTAGRFFDALAAGCPRAAFVSMELPGMDGREVIRVLRSDPQTRGMALVAVSRGRRRREEVIAGFEAGADEFLEEPCEPDLLAARLESILRRRPQAPPRRVAELDGLSLDLDARVCSLRGAAVTLTRIEFDLLEHLVRHRGRILTRGALLSAVWRRPAGRRTVDKHVESLRRKLAGFARRLDTVVNVGYVLR
ncbi:MAG: response regulator transcription factor [Elusimicrobia bacterium]|nr:response regulator transcription factor [Elusimicrobiota bacterium]